MFKFLEFWPLELVQHFANMALVNSASTGPVCSSPQDSGGGGGGGGFQISVAYCN